ncbi:hypothetical protein HDE_08349 [Halotydeus destructor]|nr:hypothetical protein HDE_08349 [Halotydeus destructor]
MSIGLGMFRSRSAPSPSSSDTEEGTASSYKKLLSRTLTNPVRTMRNMVELDEDEETEDGEQQQGDNQTGNLMTRSIRRKFWSKARPPNPMNLLKLVEGHLTLESDSTVSKQGLIKARMTYGHDRLISNKGP